MKNLLACVRNPILLALAAGAAVLPLRAANTAALNDVLKLKTAGVEGDTIVAYIQSKNLRYDLTAEDLLSLRGQGVPPEVLNAMLASGGGAAAAPPAPAPATPTPTTTPTPPPAPAPGPAIPPVPPGPGGTATPPPVPAPVPVLVAQPVTDPDVAFFYQELSPYGRWIIAENGQWCWQPRVVAGSPGWRPYWDKGRWMWTDHGWYWASDYSWGWATFHYGRWNLHPLHGWVWYPDRLWGPAWVVWRTGGDYSGWAPLPPGAVFEPDRGYFEFHGRRVEAGFDFGLGMAHFNFCLSRDLRDANRSRLRGEHEVITAFRVTAVMNEYSANRVVVGGESRFRVFNHGIDPRRLPPGRGRSFEPIRIEELHSPAPGRAHERFDAKQRTLEVYRPRFGGHRGP